MERSNKKIKRRKSGIDEIPNEIWKYEGGRLEEWALKFCNRIWRGEERWRGVIVPVMKKGEGKEVEDYRGVTLTSTLYKIYTMVLAERIRKEVEEKGIVPENQTGFRKGIGTMDNIYVYDKQAVGEKKKKDDNNVCGFEGGI